MERVVGKKLSQAARTDGVFTIDTATFIITDELKIVSAATGFLQTRGSLDITGTDDAELMDVTVELSKIMNLFKASLISQTPLSDVLLHTTRQTDSVGDETKQEASRDEIEKKQNPYSKKMMLKVMVQKSTNRLLFAQAKEDFIEFLFSLLAIPLGGVERLLASNTSIKSIDNLYRSVSDLIDDEYFKSSDMKKKLIKPKLPHGYVSKNQILPLDEEWLPAHDNKCFSLTSSENFPLGQGKYIKGSRLYQVFDDLTVTPYCFSSILCSFNKQKIPVSDLEEMEMEIGLEEALRILKASLTSNSALTNALLNPYQTNNQSKKHDSNPRFSIL